MDKKAIFVLFVFFMAGSSVLADNQPVISRSALEATARQAVQAKFPELDAASLQVQKLSYQYTIHERSGTTNENMSVEFINHLPRR